MQLTIVTPERTVYSDTVDQVTLPTTSGEVTILPNHISLVSVLAPGELSVKKGGQATPYAVSGGFVQVESGNVTILADTAEHATEIMEQRAEEARARALKAREEQHFDSEEFAILSAKIEKELARVKVARKYRHKGHAGLTDPEVASIQKD